MSKIVKGGTFGHYENPVCCKISKKLKGDPLETLKSCRKKTKNDHFEHSHSFGLFQHPFSCKISKKLKGGPFGDNKIKKSLIAPKKNRKGGRLFQSRPVL